MLLALRFAGLEPPFEKTQSWQYGKPARASEEEIREKVFIIGMIDYPGKDVYSALVRHALWCALFDSSMAISSAC